MKQMSTCHAGSWHAWHVGPRRFVPLRTASQRHSLEDPDRRSYYLTSKLPTAVCWVVVVVSKLHLFDTCADDISEASCR